MISEHIVGCLELGFEHQPVWLLTNTMIKVWSECRITWEKTSGTRASREEWFFHGRDDLPDRNNLPISSFLINRIFCSSRKQLSKHIDNVIWYTFWNAFLKTPWLACASLLRTTSDTVKSINRSRSKLEVSLLKALPFVEIQQITQRSIDYGRTCWMEEFLTGCASRSPRVYPVLIQIHCTSHNPEPVT